MLRVCANWVAIAAIFLSLCLPGQADDQPPAAVSDETDSQDPTDPTVKDNPR